MSAIPVDCFVSCPVSTIIGRRTTSEESHRGSFFHLSPLFRSFSFLVSLFAMVYRSTERRSQFSQQLSDSDLSSLEEGTSSPKSSSEEDERSTRQLVNSQRVAGGRSSAVYFSEGEHRHGRIRRGLHKVHKRVREAKGKGREVVSRRREDALKPVQK